MEKSSTDKHWDTLAETEAAEEKVNIADVSQRDVENSFIVDLLKPEDKVLEVGCGNGFSTSVFRKHAAHVDAFDYSEPMIKRAKAVYGEENNKFFVGNVLDVHTLPTEQYDVVVCVRVLINLQNPAEQLRALENIARLVRSGGRVIFIEGFREGFEAINQLRAQLGMKALVPAPINFYGSVNDFEYAFRSYFREVDVRKDFSVYDFLTRVYYPLVNGEKNVSHNTDFHKAAAQLAVKFAGTSTWPSRLAMYVGVRR